MGQFFGSIYCWFEDFFGLELADYLWGVLSPRSDTNIYIGIGLTMLAISLGVALTFYYLVNHPRLNNWWCWLIFLAVNAGINFIVGWQWVLKHYYAGLMVKYDAATNLEVAANVQEADIICFGVANMLLSVLAFAIFSFIVKWWSTNCHNAPI